MENKEFKFVCPDCGGVLESWEEKVFDSVCPIREDGTIGENKMNVASVVETGCFGIRCVGCNASTYVDGEGEKHGKN